MAERVTEFKRAPRRGSVEVITGCMFSGKTDELIRLVRRATFAHQKVQVFKSAIDQRYSGNDLASHSGRRLEATPVNNVGEIRELLEKDTDVVAIDEAQFFGDKILTFVQELADVQRIRVIVVGLEMDFRAEPFGPMPVLMAQADTIEKLDAICMVCGATATRTQRLVNGQPAKRDDPVVVVGAKELYEARCRFCHEVSEEPGNSSEG